jgi:hypothetical protein
MATNKNQGVRGLTNDSELRKIGRRAIAFAPVRIHAIEIKVGSVRSRIAATKGLHCAPPMHPKGIILLDPFPRKIERIFDERTKRHLERLGEVIWHDGTDRKSVV